VKTEAEEKFFQVRSSIRVITLLKGLGRAQANDAGWPQFDGTYVTYPQFKKEWWAYRRTDYAHVRYELVCQTLKKSLAWSMKALVWHGEPERGVGHLRQLLRQATVVHSKGPAACHQVQEVYAIPTHRYSKILFCTQIRHERSQRCNLLRKLIIEQTLPNIIKSIPCQTGSSGQRRGPP
jgi:hypothetical protein